MLIGKIVEVSGLPGKVLAPYPKMGRYNSLEYMFYDIIYSKSLYWLGLVILDEWILVPIPLKVKLAILKSIQIIGATWIILGINSINETIFLSKLIGPVKLHYCKMSSEFEFNNFASTFTYLLEMLLCN